MDRYLEENKGRLGEGQEEEIAQFVEAAKQHVIRTKKTKQTTFQV